MTIVTHEELAFAIAELSTYRIDDDAPTVRIPLPEYLDQISPDPGNKGPAARIITFQKTAIPRADGSQIVAWTFTGTVIAK